MTWADDAACRGLDLDLFFVDGGCISREARLTCAGCPVRSQCLEAALAIDPDDDYGYQGGTSRAERKRIRKARGWVRGEGPIDHGTTRGYRQHYRRDVLPVCEDCKTADRIAQRRYRERYLTYDRNSRGKQLAS